MGRTKYRESGIREIFKHFRLMRHFSPTQSWTLGLGPALPHERIYTHMWRPSTFLE